MDKHSTEKHSDSSILNMTEGNTFKLLAVFALPMLVGNIFQQIYNLVDSIIVGKLVGADALASIGATSSITFLFFALCNGISSGGGILTSQHFGRNDTSSVKKCIMNTAYIMLIFPTIVGITAFITAPYILRILDTPATIMTDSLLYLRTMCVGIVFVSMYNFISAMLRALGDSKTPLYFLIFSCILNAILDFIFVYFFNLSVLGAGIATVISQCVSGVTCIIYALKSNSYFKFAKEDMKTEWKIMWRTLKLGIPLSLQFALIAISCMALQRVVNSFGETAVAAFTATSRIEQIIHQPYGTLGTALSTYTGQNYGAGKGRRIFEGYHKSLIIMLVFSLMMLPIMTFFGQGIIKIFVDEQPVIEMGAKALSITSLFYVFLGLIYVIRGVLNGLGDAFFALLNGIVEVIGRFAVPIMLTSISSIGLWGIWWSVGIVWFVSGATAWMRYMFYRKRIQSISKE